MIMELADCIQNRASIRKYASDPVSETDLREMIRRAGMAPSVNNSQPWQFIVVTHKDLLEQAAGRVHEKIDTLFPPAKVKSTVDHFSTFFENAPAVIFVAIKPYSAIADKMLDQMDLSHEDLNSIRRYPDLQSIGAAVEHLLLSAVDLGYGGCWLSGLMVARKELEELLQIRQPWSLVAAVSVGKPAGHTVQSEKKPLDEIFTLIA
jgi:nitroreductase